MDPIFPLDKQPLRAGFSRELEDNVVRRQNDTGVPETRRVTSQVRERFAFTYIITDAQRAILTTWYRDEIAQGAKRFRITIDGTTYRAQLEVAPTLTPVGGSGWQLSFSIITLGEVI